MSIILNKDSVPFSHGIQEMVPNFILNYDLNQSPKGGSAIAIHVIRSAATLLSKAVLIVVAFVELAIRRIFNLLNEGYNRALSPNQKAKVANFFHNGKAVFVSAYADVCGPLFEKAQRPN